MIIGLTGPIGCGKSTVGRLLAARGALVIDADVVAREVSAPGTPGHAEILATFGDAVRTPGDESTVDRGRLARIVFADADALRTLERIVHPRVRPAILRRIAGARAAGAPAVVLEAIKLLEGGLAELCDLVLLVDCDPDEQRARLAGRGMAVDDARGRIAAQGAIRERLAAAGATTLSTSGDLDALDARVATLWQRVARGASSRPRKRGDVR